MAAAKTTKGRGKGKAKAKAKAKAEPIKKETVVEPETGGEMGVSLTRDDLVAAATDMTVCLGLEPEIDTELDDEDLGAALVAAAELITDKDVINARAFKPGTSIRARVGKMGDGPYMAIETLDTLEALGVKLPEGKAAAKKAATKKAAKKRNATRAEVFRDLVADGAAVPKADLVAKMVERYGGSENEARFQVDVFTRLLLAMGYMQKDDKGLRLVEPLA